MKHSLHMGAAALALSLAGTALAADINAVPPPATAIAPGAPFNSLDTNKDGRLSQSEVRANADLNGRFATLDSDGDTYISQLEYGKWDGSGRTAPGVTDPNPSTKPATPMNPGDPTSSSNSTAGDKASAGKSPP